MKYSLTIKTGTSAAFALLHHPAFSSAFYDPDDDCYMFVVEAESGRDAATKARIAVEAAEGGAFACVVRCADPGLIEPAFLYDHKVGNPGPPVWSPWTGHFGSAELGEPWAAP